MNMPYLDRADSRAMLKRIRDYNEDELKAMNTNAVKSGATDEAKVAAANKLNKNYSQTLAQIAGLGEQHKDQVRRDYQARMDNLTGTRYQAQLGKAAGTQNMISGIGSSLGQLAMLYGMGSGSGGGLANLQVGNSMEQEKPTTPVFSIADEIQRRQKKPTNAAPHGSRNASELPTCTGTARTRFWPSSTR